MAEKRANKRYQLTNGPIASTLVSMTIPMILGMLMMFSFNLVDTFFISMLGTEALSAISFTFPVTFTIMSLAIGLSIGTSAVVAKYIGRGETEKAKEASTVTNYVAMALAGVLALVGYLLMDQIFLLLGASESLLPAIRDYMDIWLPTSILLVALICANSVLRANGDTRTPSIVMASAGLVNAALDPLLIFGWGPVPAMGIQGAALATLFSWVGACIFLFYFLAIRHELIHKGLPSAQVFKTSAGLGCQYDDPDCRRGDDGHHCRLRRHRRGRLRCRFPTGVHGLHGHSGPVEHPAPVCQPEPGRRQT